MHLAQVLTYLRLNHKPLGLLINFNVPVLKEGIHRIVVERPSDDYPCLLCASVSLWFKIE